MLNASNFCFRDVIAFDGAFLVEDDAYVFAGNAAGAGHQAGEGNIALGAGLRHLICPEFLAVADAGFGWFAEGRTQIGFGGLSLHDLLLEGGGRFIGDGGVAGSAAHN